MQCNKLLVWVKNEGNDLSTGIYSKGSISLTGRETYLILISGFRVQPLSAQILLYDTKTRQRSLTYELKIEFGCIYEK